MIFFMMEPCMVATARLALPLLAAAQAQKHVTHNEALAALDALVMLAVATAGAASPPGSPAAGERHIVGAGATGAWAGHDGEIAAWAGTWWDFYAPQAGWRAFDAGTATMLVHDGAGWERLVATAPDFGVNATPDATNRLAVAAGGTRLSHDGAGHRVTVNKAALAETASLLFQTGWSGRAEIGLAGSDALSVRVSADGAAWTEALHVAADGRIGAGTASPTARLTVVGTDLTGATGDIAVVKENYWSLNFFDTYSATPVHSPFAILRRARGTAAAPEAVAAGDQIGGFSFRAYTPMGAFAQTARVAAIVSGTPSGTSVPTDLILSCGPTTATERIRILSSGEVGIATANPTTALHVAGPVRVGSATVAGLPSASAVGVGAILYVSDESGGAVLAFSDGANWRRCTDRVVVS
jgi:hypothetical protein